MSHGDSIKYNDMVRNSRAGDNFHYRWAARFCLNMIKPGSPITSILVEQSKESERIGECVMDMTVYSSTSNENTVDYYQMKHSTVHADTHITLGDIRKTIEGFANRYQSHQDDEERRIIKYNVITNRKIGHKLKQLVSGIVNDEEVDDKIKNQLISYTKLEDAELKDFCTNLILQGGEGNYEDQFYSLIGETGRLISGVDSTDIVNRLFVMIQSRVLPNNKDEINKATVLEQFGCSSEKKLFPAPSAFELLDNVVVRDEYYRLSEEIKGAEQAIIVTASGGVGKSIFTGMLPELLGEHHLTIRYDCFGNGSYRNRMKFRHRHQDALVQIVNELAELGYCEPLIANDISADGLSEAFHDRVNEVVRRFRENKPTGKLVIAIDAADNAEMAADINHDLGFTKDLLHQELPENCILVMLCRPERLEKLNPHRNIRIFDMNPFSVDEIREYLSLHFSKFSKHDVEVIYRLTNGNPRIISIAIQNAEDIHAVLRRLGPNTTTAEEQVGVLLDNAIHKIKEQLSDDYLAKMESLCCGLAVLPPDIPIEDLSVVTGVDAETVWSFVSEMGAQFRIAEGHLHFRDEPTEKWFRDTFIGKKELFLEFIDRIEPFTATSYYLASALPELYILAERYDQLIDAALSGDFLPVNSDIDIREVEFTRLKYAMKSAIRRERYKDIIGLGLMAGEKGEIHNRMYGLYQKYFELLNLFMSKEHVRELAFRSKLCGDWLGSDLIYTTVLLSSFDEGIVEAKSYFRNAEEFLYAYIEDRNKAQEGYFHAKLTNDDIFAFVVAVHNIYGIEAVADYMRTWSPNETIFEMARRFTAYLIDLNHVDQVYQFLDYTADNFYCVVAIGLELDRVGMTYETHVIEKLLRNLEPYDIDQPQSSILNRENAAPMEAIITFCEWLLIHQQIDLCQKFLDRFISETVSSGFASDIDFYERAIYLRAFAIRKYLNSDIDFLKNDYFHKEKERIGWNEDNQKVKGIFKSLYPWYELRLSVMLGNCDDVTVSALERRQSTKMSYAGQYGRFNLVEKERYRVTTDIFLKYRWNDDKVALDYYNKVIQEEKHSYLYDRITVLRGMIRSTYCNHIIDCQETEIYNNIKIDLDEPYERVDMLMLMARAVVGYNMDDAKAYFKDALEENERFGDELPTKWKAIAALGRRTAEEFNSEEALAYRFLRAAEFVGEHVVRQKYWNRNEAVYVTTLLSAGQGLAGISRWRERNIGWIEDQLPHVVQALMDREELDIASLWGLSGFFPDNEEMVVNLAINCMLNAENNYLKDLLGNQINWLSEIKGYSEKSCKRLSNTFIQFDLETDQLYSGRQIPMKKNTSSSYYESISEQKIDNLLSGWKYNGTESLLEGFSYVHSVKGLSSGNDYYWRSLLAKVPVRQYSEFLSEILKLPNQEFWSVKRLLTNIPDSWKQRRGFEKFWSEFLKRLGEIYSSDLLSSYYRRDFERSCKWPDKYWYQLYSGCIEGLKNTPGGFHPSDYYELVTIAARLETPEVSKEYLDFGLNLLEKDIDEEFGDGYFTDLPSVPTELLDYLAAFYKMALASPDNGVRWQAVHGIIRQGHLMNSEELGIFVDRIYSAEYRAFTSRDFMFYDMNFHLYLLIALQRIAKEQPMKVMNLKVRFLSYFNGDFSHGLIQLFAEKVVRLIENKAPGTFSEKELKSVTSVFINKHAIIASDNPYRRTRLNKYAYLLDETDNFHVAYDFNRYWLNKLEQMFNIPVKHIEKMISNYVVDETEVKFNRSRIVHDARKYVFNNHRYEHKIYTSHGAHPSIENLLFYLSYHGMFIIAGRLLKENSLYVGTDQDSPKNPYLEWLQEKSLKRDDGYLLIDGRTSMPYKLPDWVGIRIADDWLEEVDEQYLVGLLDVDGDICVDGYWDYRYNGYHETVSVDTALVDPEVVESLLMTLEALPPHDYHLGEQDHFGQRDFEPFNIEEWIFQRDVYSGLDKFDPWATETRYPDYEIKEPFVVSLGLSVNDVSTEWHDTGNGSIAVYNQNWTEEFGEYDETYYYPCHRMAATEEILRKLSAATSKVIVVNVQVDRYRVKDKYGSYDGLDRHCFHIFRVFGEEGWWDDER